MPKFMKALAITVLVLMVIGSLVLGDAFKTVSVNDYGRVTSQYNFVLVLSGLLLSAIVFGLLFSIGYALERLEGIHGALEAIRENTKRSADIEPTSATRFANSTEDPATASKTVGRMANAAADPVLVNRSGLAITCPKCGKTQPSKVASCVNCGQPFTGRVTTDEPARSIPLTSPASVPNKSRLCPSCGARNSGLVRQCVVCGEKLR